MARVTKFMLTNFKGAKSVEIDLERGQIHPVVTLLGLNESGKTTILEGISKFVTEDDATKGIFQAQHSSDSPSTFIPKHLQAAFTGKIGVSALVELDDADRDAIRELLVNADIGKFDISAIKKTLNVEARYFFEDSDLTESINNWSGIDLSYLPPKKRKYIKYVRPKSNSNIQDYWLKIVRLLSSRIPKITYFPSFLVDVPERIYLSEFDEEDAVNKYYRTVLQDVLSSTDASLSLERHVVRRIADYKNESGVATWLSTFLGTDKKKQVDAVFSKMSSSISKEIIGNWARIFQRPTEAKNIALSWAIDAEKDDLPYASFHISDGDSTFEVNQRSLGFRWFFSFLLFTRFRKGKDRATIFLFDEPAANLHAKAQAELLSSFGRIVEDGNQIIYSTHSHHMIEPKWLSGAYIVENLAIDYDDTTSIDHFTSRPTEIIGTKYKNFLSQSSDRSSYYLPALEKLQYVAPSIVEHQKVVLLEGISDYHLMRYVKQQRGATELGFVPGVSASNMGSLISMLVGFSYDFIVLLDDDSAGRKERDRYRSSWSLSDDVVLTLGDLDKEYSGKKLETLLSDSTRDLIKSYYNLHERLRKKQIQAYLAESVATGATARISDDTMTMVEDIFSKVEQLLPDDN